MKPGDVVGLCCDNRREYPIPLISTLLIGCSFAPLNQAYTERKFFFLKLYFNCADNKLKVICFKYCIIFV